MEAEIPTCWVPRDSSRIWRGSYKGKVGACWVLPGLLVVGAGCGCWAEGAGVGGRARSSGCVRTVLQRHLPPPTY